MTCPRRRPVRALVALGLLASASSPAAAAADLAGVEVSEVREAEHHVSIRIEGLVARVETRQVVINPGARETEIHYAFDLPAEAAVIGAELLLSDGRRATSASIDARAAFRFVPEDGASGAPDLGLLRMLEVDADAGLARYELRAYPIAAGRSATATIRWVAPLSYRDGRLRLRVPDRGGAANLVREQVEVSWRAPAGARGVRHLRCGATRAAGGGATASLRCAPPPGADLALEAVPVFAGDRGLVAELAAVPIDGKRGALALAVLSPDRPPAASLAAEPHRGSSGRSAIGLSADRSPERVVVVVDRSRSLGAAGLAAARAITDRILADAAAGALAEVIVFDRAAAPIGGRLSADRAALRAGTARALAGPPASSGSDLGAALGQVGGLLRRAGPVADARVGSSARGGATPTLIVIVTDGMLPLALDGERARSLIGGPALGEARVASIVLVPDGAALPDLDRGPLAELGRTTGGRLVVVRHGEASERAPRLWAELGQPPPYEDLKVDWRGAVVTSDAEAPSRLEAGEGFVLVGWYHGARPTGVSLRAALRGRELSARVRPAAGILAAAALPLGLTQRPAIELLPPGELEKDDAEERARREQVRAADRAGVVTRASALVLLDPADGFARDRLAHARRWGSAQFRRWPPPAERRLGERATSDAAAKGRASSPGPSIARPRRTGELDRGLVEGLMRKHVVPRARLCYQRALRGAPRLAGTVVIELEMARGEVQHARVARSSASSPALAACLIDAAYATPVPTVALGEAGETVVVARYPLRFGSQGGRPHVAPTPDRPGTGTADPDDPLGGL